MDIREKLVEQLRWWAAECDRTNFGCQARKLLIDAADFIANGVTVQEWISVSDPPKEDGFYIVMIKGEEKSTMLRYYLLKDSWEDDFFDTPYPVTHWMPLPPTPKGE